MRFEATTEEIRALLAHADPRQGQDRAASRRRHDRGEPRSRRVPPRLLDRYEWLLGAGRAPAIVAIVRGSCSGCHLRLPTMVESRTRRAVAVHTCPHCQRMLYVPELLHGATDAGEARSR